jgi:hypothetical protein
MIVRTVLERRCYSDRAKLIQVSFVLVKGQEAAKGHRFRDARWDVVVQD